MTSHRHTYRLSLSLVLFLTPAAWAAQAQVDLIDQIKTANERDNRYDELSEAVWKKKSTALSRVVDLLESESGEERDNATKILAILQRKANFNLSKKSISRIIVLIEQNDDPGLRCQLLNLIGRTKTDGVELLPVLIKLIGSENDTVRRAAIEAIQGGTSDEKQTSKTIDLLLKALDNEDAPSIRVAAALALGRIGRHGEKVVPALTQRLSDNYLKVRDA
ncbi:MAG: HEAT repeat domain-containing protein, partial [Candidatus Obscuribacterales bacterium]|nr:HEAT repeat domain-containing protein [Candidatus Obscuribacterales bacterium]